MIITFYYFSLKYPDIVFQDEGRYTLVQILVEIYIDDDDAIKLVSYHKYKLLT